MPKHTIQNDSDEHFGARLARLRTGSGFSQRDLAREMGISQRMIAYYEKETTHPPTHLLPLFAKAFGVSTDQLLGIDPLDKIGKTRDNRLWRRFSQIEKMEPKEKRQIMQLLDTFIENNQLKQKSLSA
ncbi:MAG: helix-turn-helix transcriptional regulator [Deltaproteobacteria bacterium]|nr:helix-turn-helix transcriptional regulator [Deltaproteobacteria bacterium]